MTSLPRSDWVESVVRARCFPPPARSNGDLTLGAELELLAVDGATRKVARIAPGNAPGTIDVARAAGARLGWSEGRSAKGVPRFLAASGASLTFEPGGQIEFASAVHRSVDALLRELREAERVLREESSERGIDLLAVGIDPENHASQAPLQLLAPRYRRMAAYLARIGAHGARMMRQTASFQICVGGASAQSQFRLANAIAPWLTALFASSPRYAGVDTRCVSYRAETWRGVDSARTGLLEGRDPVREYAAFALAAPAFLTGAPDAPPLPFARLRDVQADTLEEHLTTLFPDVRPRGYLELRSLDAVEHEQRCAALVLVAGLFADRDAAAHALEIVGPPDPQLLQRAGRIGLADDRIAAGTPDLIDAALAGCARLGREVLSAEARERAGDALRALGARARRDEAALVTH
jgi:glutamate--cysteine ligase